MTSFRWIFPAAAAAGADALRAELDLAPLAARVLIRRGLSDPGAARLFLEAPLSGLHDPFLLRDMDRAVARLERAVRSAAKIQIHGDYDVDGVTSVALLMKVFAMACATATWRVPHRLRDGYGIRPEAVEAAAAEGVTLIVSVDTGIRAGSAVSRAAELGIDTIVTDHHLPEAAMPPAVAILNPNRPDCSYPDKNLCGATIAFKLAQALLSRLGWSGDRLARVSESLLRIVAIATVADVTPLTGENRIIVKRGLADLAAARNPGLRSLLEVAGIAGGESVTARQVAFQIAPRINAAGRMDTAERVVELFLTGDERLARAIAAELHARNAERQKIEAAIRDACERMPVDPGAAALVYYRPDWHRGVLGIVASRLVERRRRPVFVLGLDSESGLAQGSGRSIPAFHLLEALDSMPELFLRYGGHAHAAGVTLAPERIPEFRERLNAFAAAHLGEEDFAPQLEIDAIVDPEEIGEDAVRSLDRLAPFGHGNPQPLLAALDVEVSAPPVVFAQKHLRVTVKRNGRSLTLKAWNQAEDAAFFLPGARLDIAFTVEADPYSAARGYQPWTASLRAAREAGPSGLPPAF